MEVIVMEDFMKIIEIIKQPKHYVPKDYVSMGGMWASDVWVYRDVIVNLMDEGYTLRIFAKGIVEVYRDHKNELLFYTGNEESLKIILNRLTKEE